MSALAQVAGHRRVSWLAWARSLRGLTPAEALVARELALLADEYGVAIVTSGHLASATALGRASVFRALTGLEARGMLERSRTRVNGRQGPNRVQLRDREQYRAGTAECETSRLVALTLVDAGGGVIVDRDDNEGFRRLLRSAQAEQWQGGAAQVVARSLVEAAPRQFWDAIIRLRDLGGFGSSQQDATGEIVSIAYEECQANCDRLISSARPWAMLTTIVTRSVTTAPTASVESVSPFEFPETGLRPGQGISDDEVFVSVDALPGAFRDLIAALVTAGMSQSIAWAGTRRIAELAIGDSSRRHTLAARDPRLADLGVQPEAAREWMTALVGSRSGARAGVLVASREYLGECAAKIMRIQNGV